MMQRVLLSIAAVVFAGATWLGYQAWHVYRAIHDTTSIVVPRPTDEPTVTIPPLNGNQRINILVLGSDNDRKKEEASPLTQSMIVVTIDPMHDQVGMLSIPRDFYVRIPHHGMGKIDLAHKYGGVQLARQTVEALFHIPIHYYAWVGLNGFIRVINTFHGVTLDVAHPILDDFYPNDLAGHNAYAYKRLFIPAGWQHMTGDEALQYVRSRHGDLVGDFGRSSRQQQVLVQLDQKINAMNVLLNLPALADDLTGSVKTDLGLMKLYQLEQLSRHIHHADVHQVVLQAPTYCHYGWSWLPGLGWQSILVPDWNRIWPVVRTMFAPIAASRPAPGRAARPSTGPRTRPVPASSRRAPSVATPRPTVLSTPTPVPTPTPPSLARLPASLVFEQDGNLFMLNRDRSLRQLTWQGDASMPAPSPDGRRIAFVRFTRGLQRYGKFASDVWLLDPATEPPRQYVVTHDESPQPYNNLWTVWPSWSPDGSRLVFSSDRAKLAYNPGKTPDETRPVDLAVWSMPAGGGAQKQLTTPVKGAGGDTEPTPRPGTRQILYVKWSYSQSSNTVYSQLELHDTVSGREWPLTEVGGRVLDPQWDRHGRRITYIEGQPNGVDQVMVAPVVSGKNGPEIGRRVALAAGHLAQPAFTPNGRWVSYLQADGENFDLYMVPAAGGVPQKVDNVPSGIDPQSRPVWVP